MNDSLNLDWVGAVQSFPFLLNGLVLTIVISTFGLLFGFIIGLAAGLAKTSSRKWLNASASFYIAVVRGTPIMVQAVWLYFGLNQLLMQLFQFRIGAVYAGIIVIAVNGGAYIAEIVRGAVESIDKGQVEAGRSLGMSGRQTFRYIVWPQALKRMIPPLGNQFIISLKDTSLLTVISVGELLRHGQEIVANRFNAFEIYTMVALLYLLLTLVISQILQRLERRLALH